MSDSIQVELKYKDHCNVREIDVSHSDASGQTESYLNSLVTTLKRVQAETNQQLTEIIQTEKSKNGDVDSLEHKAKKPKSN